MHKLAFALAGGGARGAYVAGVLRYLLTHLPKDLGYVPWPKIVSGASVGALNGYPVACHDHGEIHRMLQIWRNMQIDHIYTLPSGVLNFLQTLNRASYNGGMLDSTPLYELIKRETARKSLRKGIHPDRCHAFLIAATHLASGTSTIFADCFSPHLHVPNLPGGRVIRTTIQPEHIIASGSIPCIFPPVRIKDEWYLDGALHMYAPLHPLIKMGANRILVLGTRAEQDERAASEAISPTISSVAGLSFNAMGLDHIERDALAIEQTNQLIDWGVQTYGAEFAQKLESERGLRQTKVLHLRPSRSLSLLAYEVFVAEKIKAPKNLRWMFSKIHEQSTTSESSFLLSFLLFDQLYTTAAEDLGYQDAKLQKDVLLSFFS